MSDSATNLTAHAEELRRILLRQGSLMLDVKVIPKARTAEVSDVMANGVLKVKVTAAPAQGRANEEVMTLLAAFLGLSQRNLEVVAGHHSPQKRLKVVV